MTTIVSRDVCYECLKELETVKIKFIVVSGPVEDSIEYLCQRCRLKRELRTIMICDHGIADF